MKIGQAVIENKELMIQDIVKLLKVPSVLGNEEIGKPFGIVIDAALDVALDIADKLGYRTFKDPNGYYGYAEIGAGEELIGILGHLDVVPEGDVEHWSFPPYEGAIHNGRIYGRGVQDDKGPVVASMYAVKALMDLKYELNKRIRFIFGTDEENHWRGICKYMSEQEVPAYGFTPDSSFPVIYAEKGLLQVKLKSDKPSPVNVRAGMALNAVPESAQVKCEQYVKLERVLKRMGFDYENDGEEILVIGRSSHAAKPNAGINAINRLALALKEMNISSPAIDFLADKVGLTNFGELIFGDCRDEISGKLTLNVGKVDFSKYGEMIAIDIRFPVTVKKDFVVNAIKRVAEKYGLKYHELDYLAPIYTEREHPLVAELTRVYIEETGLDGTPLATGGATYARAMKNCVAFGATFPGQPRLEHQVDEYVEIDYLIKATQIYAKAIKALIER